MKKIYRTALTLILALALTLGAAPAVSLADAAGIVDSAFNDFAPVGGSYNVCSGNIAQTAYGTVSLNESVTTATDSGYM